MLCLYASTSLVGVLLCNLSEFEMEKNLRELMSYLSILLFIDNYNYNS